MSSLQAAPLLGDLGEAIADCSVTIVVQRFRRTPVVQGRKQIGSAFDTFECQASIQPMSNRELQQLPEGQRNSGRIKGYTTEELKTVQTSDCKQPDRLEYRGVTYEIDKVDDWMDLGGYFKIEAERVTR